MMLAQIARVSRLLHRPFGVVVQLPKFLEPHPACASSLHTTCYRERDHRGRDWLAPLKWNDKNDEVFSPLKDSEERRPAWVCHSRGQIRISAKKLYYLAILIRGLTVDEALKQLKFCERHGADFVKEVLLEAQEMAIKEHNVEYKSNLWVAESFVSKGVYVKGLRRHARMRWGQIDWKFCHYYIKLEEGTPPEFFYRPILTDQQKLDNWIEERRNRTIPYSL